MDDITRLKAEFILGKDIPVVVSEPTPAQGLVLALSRTPANAGIAQQMRLVRRVFSVLEAMMGQDTWDNVVESAMINEQIEPEDLMRFVQDVAGFNWSEHRRELTDPIPQQSPEPIPPTRPAPRVISGG